MISGGHPHIPRQVLQPKDAPVPLECLLVQPETSSEVPLAPLEDQILPRDPTGVATRVAHRIPAPTAGLGLRAK